VWISATRCEPYQDTRRCERFGFPFCPRAAERLQQQCRFRGALRYERRGTLPKFIAGQNGGDAQLTGRPPENLAIGQVIELFSLVKLFQDFRSARWVTGQHAGGEIECLTGSLDQSLFKMMDVSCHKSGDTLRGYVRDADAFRDHAEAGLL